MKGGWLCTKLKELDGTFYSFDMNKDLRSQIYAKYNGRCAYSGTLLEEDWQVDHFYPKRYLRIVLPQPEMASKLQQEGITSINCFNNLMPTQSLINHYKRALLPDSFRNWYLRWLHLRLAKLPKNPRTDKSIKHKQYLLQIAKYFGVTVDQPFSGVFYFEKYKRMHNTSDKYLLQIEPKGPKSEQPNHDFLTHAMTEMLASAKVGRIYRGFHKCICGKTSGCADLYVGGYITNSLASHYLKWHRDEVPQSEINKVLKLIRQKSKIRRTK